ncbi:hypothetical protein AYK21_02990 [Thermoplasmatales archaeon SG8-52-2]|nr:MAG: hypothetical protein AYK21_02990 [Thermoplasmatales archaeon SG8-52-2]
MRDNKYRGLDYNFSEEETNRKKNKYLKIFAVSIVVIIIIGIFGSVVYNAGYIPMKRFMEVKKPLGNADEINIDEHIYKHPEIKKFPYLDRLKYKVFGTNRSISVVANDYKEELEKDGFKLLYDGVAYKGDIPLQYYGYLKGLTGVGIIITDDENVTQAYETMILYTTGNALDYRKILTWYRDNSDIVGDIYI